MGIKLSDNIRKLRKEHSLTQQQLADALGVTAGAVYKWEAELSAPDLSLLVELANLFDVSVDVLLGYEIKSSKQADMAARLKEHMHNRNRDGIAEAQKALLRYPNSFDIVYQSAILYYMFGLTDSDNELLRRSIELMERSILLLGQNTDPEISELSIIFDMANVWYLMGDGEKMLELLKKDNPRGINNYMIGQILARERENSDEAEAYLSKALLSVIVSLVSIVSGYMNLYFNRKDFASGASILQLTLDFFACFKKAGKNNFLDKPCADFYVCLAYARLELGEPDKAREALGMAKELAEEFDKNPDYAADSLRFIQAAKYQTAFDNLGRTAMESVADMVDSMGSDSLKKLWETVI